jgi:hypothetical protein
MNESHFQWKEPMSESTKKADTADFPPFEPGKKVEYELTEGEREALTEVLALLRQADGPEAIRRMLADYRRGSVTLGDSGSPRKPNAPDLGSSGVFPPFRGSK